MDRGALAVLEGRGIIPFAPGFAEAGEYSEPAWARNFALAMDAQPALVTSPNAGIPAYLANLLDPEIVRVLVSPLKSVEIYGETKKGDWTTLSTQFPLVENTGVVSSYGDFSNNGSTNANVNWVPRQSYHFQTVTEWGERELEMYGLAKINYANEMNMSSVMTLERFRNKANFFGINRLQLYGALNDPALFAPILPTVKTAGGYTWAVATAQEIYNDVLLLFQTLQAQLKGLAPDMDAKLVLAMSPTMVVNLKKVSIYNVTAEQTIKENFKNLRIETAPEFTTASGELLQFFLEEIDGIRSVYTAFTEKLRAHPVIPSLSSWKQKKSAGTWGSIIRRPIAFVQMLGV